MSGTKEQIQYRCQCENPDWEIIETDSKIYMAKNHHPTVKPLALMEYLIKLVSARGAVLLDPYCGSGTTAMGCVNTGRKYIVIDNEPEYVKITKCRVRAIPGTLF